MEVGVGFPTFSLRGLFMGFSESGLRAKKLLEVSVLRVYPTKPITIPRPYKPCMGLGFRGSTRMSPLVFCRQGRRGAGALYPPYMYMYICNSYIYIYIYIYIYCYMYVCSFTSFPTKDQFAKGNLGTLEQPVLSLWRFAGRRVWGLGFGYSFGDAEGACASSSLFFPDALV